MDVTIFFMKIVFGDFVEVPEAILIVGLFMIFECNVIKSIFYLFLLPFENAMFLFHVFILYWLPLTKRGKAHSF